MQFSSIEFLFFAVVVLLIYNLIGKKFRLPLLLFASYFFYCLAQPGYAILLLGVSLLTYFSARLISKPVNARRKKSLLWGAVLLILLPLCFFKYYPLLNQSIVALLNSIGLSLSGPSMPFLLPIGISFYTFMALGYVIDVYYEDVEPEKNFCVVALFLSFFPYVFSGPIERAGRMFPQIKSVKDSTPADISQGLKMVLWGLFMKYCVADRLAIIVNPAFEYYQILNPSDLILAVIFYAIQIYADFGGYSLIAIGLARTLGFDISPNFLRPFFSKSLSELWRRWHISLFSWLYDYVFGPLSYKLKHLSSFGIAIAITLTFLLSGLWHGANMTFIVWGLLNGILICCEAFCRKRRTRIETRYYLQSRWWYVFLRMMLVFLVFALCTMICRCNSINQAWDFMHKVLTEPIGYPILLARSGKKQAFAMVLSILLLMFKDIHDEFLPDKRMLLSSNHFSVRCLTYLCVTCLILSLGVFSEGQYIYFKF